MKAYIIECIKENKKISGRKISSWKKDHPNCIQEAYMELYGVDNNCVICDNKTSFISVKEGFRKYCSKECSNVALSKSNIERNKRFNTKKSIETQNRNNKLSEDVIKYYQENLVSIRDVSSDFDLPYSAVKSILSDNIDSNRQTKIYQKNLKSKFSSVNTFLSNTKFIQDKIDISGYTTKDFSDELGCSKNYVSVKLRGQVEWNKFTSSQEQKVYNLLSGHNVIRNDRSQIYPKELDLYLPEHNLGIEVNGLYWHSFKEKNYHLDKTESFNGRLLHFTDKEIDESFDKVSSIIKSALGESKKIYARKCKIEEISSSVYMNFCRDNHIQEGVNASIRLGCIYEDNLVAILGIGKSRFNKKYQYEILRYCSTLNTNVIGGFSKLFSYFKKKYESRSIISYCQRRLFNGKMYEFSGFKFSHYTQPNYVWFDGRQILSRHQTQMKDENFIMREKDFRKFYDCGQKVYVYND